MVAVVVEALAVLAIEAALVPVIVEVIVAAVVGAATVIEVVTVLILAGVVEVEVAVAVVELGLEVVEVVVVVTAGTVIEAVVVVVLAAVLRIAGVGEVLEAAKVEGEGLGTFLGLVAAQVIIGAPREVVEGAVAVSELMLGTPFAVLEVEGLKLVDALGLVLKVLFGVIVGIDTLIVVLVILFAVVEEPVDDTALVVDELFITGETDVSDDVLVASASKSEAVAAAEVGEGRGTDWRGERGNKILEGRGEMGRIAAVIIGAFVGLTGGTVLAEKLGEVDIGLLGVAEK